MAIEDATVAPSYKRGVEGKGGGVVFGVVSCVCRDASTASFSSWKDWKGFVDLTDGSRFPWKTEGELIGDKEEKGKILEGKLN